MMSKFIALCAVVSAVVQSIDVDCNTASCPDTCTCSLSQCKAKVDDCLGDAECAKQHDCAFQCACGDESCLLNCVGQTSSPFAVPLMECVQNECLTTMLSASATSVDCDAATCKETCQCATDKCASSVEACLADAECSTAQTCALACPCGDEECLLGCVSETNSPLATPVAECITSKCPVSQTLLGSPNLSCHGSACEDSCKCAKSKCLGKGMACLLDPKCSEFQACSFKCACGDAECAIKCAEELSSPKAMPLAKCITERCHQQANI